MIINIADITTDGNTFERKIIQDFLVKKRCVTCKHRLLELTNKLCPNLDIVLSTFDEKEQKLNADCRKYEKNT
jgi:hypothetical protein